MAGRSSPEAIDRMIRNITKFIELQQDVAQALKSDYVTAGEDWDDIQYQKLGASIEQVISALYSSYVPLDECVTRLQMAKTHLEDYLSQ